MPKSKVTKTTRTTAKTSRAKIVPLPSNKIQVLRDATGMVTSVMLNGKKLGFLTSLGVSLHPDDVTRLHTVTISLLADVEIKEA